MGCVTSRIDDEERVQICKQRKRLMKQLVAFRREFADSQLDYLRALKNTGVTLRQFTESNSLEIENTADEPATLPVSPPISLPPSPPPPPPPLSPYLRKCNDNQKAEGCQVESRRINADDCCTPPPQFTPTSSWVYWDPFDSSLPPYQETREMAEAVIQDEIWAETKSEFEEEDHAAEVSEIVCTDLPPQKHQQQPGECVDDTLSTISSHTTDMTMLVGKIKKTLDGIVKELDEYFLKASASGKEVALLMDISKVDTSRPQDFTEKRRNRSNSAKVFNALSWSWSSKSLQLAKDVEVCTASEPCKIGAHCATLEKLYAAEQKLYKEVKEEEMTKLEYEKKSMLLARHVEEGHDLMKIEKIRSNVENLEIEIRRLQYSISRTSSSMVELINLELFPQLKALISGLRNIWRIMYQCHKIQYHISQELNHLTNNEVTDFTTTDSHRQATSQLENEVSSLYISFCRLLKSQQEYVTTLSKWNKMTSHLVGDKEQGPWLSPVSHICEEWKSVFDKLPDKIAAESIKGFQSSIQLIMRQQEEELSFLKKSDKLERRLEKELSSQEEMEQKLELSSDTGDKQSSLSPKHPLSLKRAKTAALKKILDTEKSKYMNSVQVTRVMTLNNLKTSLPTIFQALMSFSNASAKAFEAIHRRCKPATELELRETQIPPSEAEMN